MGWLLKGRYKEINSNFMRVGDGSFAMVCNHTTHVARSTLLLVGKGRGGEADDEDAGLQRNKGSHESENI